MLDLQNKILRNIGSTDFLPIFKWRNVPLVHTWCRELGEQTEVSKIRQHSLALEEQGGNRKERHVKGTKTRRQDTATKKKKKIGGECGRLQTRRRDYSCFFIWRECGERTVLKLEALAKYRPKFGWSKREPSCSSGTKISPGLLIHRPRRRHCEWRGSASVQKEQIGSTATLELQFIRSVNVTADLIQVFQKVRFSASTRSAGSRRRACSLSSWHRPLDKTGWSRWREHSDTRATRWCCNNKKHSFRCEYI